ncbi:MAG: hypothetical protein JWR38_1147 [Mucilaginibacter sp.]|nr:hypothetical protein [Mucilaginibacter sp.]
MTSLRASAQTFDWSCFPTAGTILADANGIANFNLTAANCSVANGWVLQCQGTGEQRILSSALGGNPYIRMQKVGTDATFSFARILTASGALFTLKSISVTPTSVGAAAGGNQVITLHAFKGGHELGSTSTGSLSSITLVNIPESQLGAFVNIDEIRFTSDQPAAFGVGIDDVVIVAAPTAPTVTTDNFAAITTSSATLTGTVTADGGSTVTEKGIVYGTLPNPNIVTGTKVTNGSGTGAISANASGLASNTTYYFRAYATNIAGTAYGQNASFKTLIANIAPVAVADNYNFNTGTALTVAAPGVLGNDTDADGDPLTAVLVSGPANGTLTLNPNGSFTYNSTSTANDQFTYKVNDGKVDGNTVTVTLTRVNTAPIIAASAGTSLFSGTDAFIDPGITVSDDGSTLASGVVSITGGFHSSEDQLALIPNGSTGDIVGSYNGGTGFLLLGSPSATATVAQWQAALRRIVYRNAQAAPTVNTRTISFLVSDGSLNSNAVTKTVSIAPPVAVLDNYSYQSGIALTIPTPGVLGNDTSPGGSPLSAILVTGPTNGTLVLNPNGSFTYTSTGGTNDQFTYKVNNGHLDGNTVAVTLVRSNSAPVANNDTYTVTANTPFSGNVFDNDSDPDGDQLFTSANTSPAHGTLILNANGSFTYIPNIGTTGDDTFNYQVCDNGIPSFCASATVVFHVSAPVNQAPVLVASAGQTIFSGSPIPVDAGITVTDADNSTLASATISMTGSLHIGEDALLFTPGGATGNITGSFSTITERLNLSSAGNTATVAQWQAALRAVAYQDQVPSPNTTTRTVTFVVNDGTNDSNPVSKSVVFAMPAISAGGTLSALNTTYGTASASGTFNVSGTNLTAGILVTAPAGFEVSIDNVTFTHTVTIGSGGNIASTPVQIRLAAGNNAGTYSGFVALSSAGAGGINVPTVASTVSPKKLTITAKNITKTYGQTLTGGATTTEFTVAGLVGTETVGNVTIAYGTGTAANAAVNTYTGSVTASAANGGTFTPTNYAIDYIAGNIVVNKAALTITANNKGKAFGSALTGGPGSIDFTSTGLVNAETIGSVTITYGVGAAANAAVGAYLGSIVPSAATSGTFNAANYTITYTAGTLTVGQAILTITANSATKTYGSPVPILTVTYSGFVGTDDASSLTTQPTISTPGVTNSPVGSYPITPSGAVSSNYTIVYQPGTLTVTPASLTVTANNWTKTYGQTLTGGAGSTAFTSAGLVGTETIGSVTITYGAGGAAGDVANTYTGAIVPSTATGGTFNAANYNISYAVGNITVGKAPITVTANTQAKTYGEADPALTYTVTSGALAGTDKFTGRLTRAAGENAGTYAIQQGTLAVGSNYTLTYVDANLTIGKAPITVTADAQTKTYGDVDPALAYNITSGTLAFADTFTGRLTRAPGENAGTYAIQQGTLAISSNYTLTYAGANLTIGKAAITVTADPQTKAFGAADPALTYKISSGTLKFADTFTGALTRVPGESAGTYAIQQGTLALSSNYTLTYVGANLTIGKTAITITADVQTKSYGDVDPVLTYKITSGALLGTDKFTGTLTRAPGENVGTYAIQQGTLALSSNYTLTYVGANLTIGKAAITVTADPQTKDFGVADPALTFKITSGTLKFADTFTGALTRVPGESTGTYAIQQGTLALSSNYALTYVGANLTIGKIAITVTADTQTKAYGAADPTLTYKITTGTLVGTDKFTGTLTRVAGENAGTYAIQQGTLALSSNYTLTYVGANLTVGKTVITVTADAQTKAYGAVDPVLTYKVTSGALAFVDTFTGALTRVAGENAGTYAIQQGTLALSSNYTLTYVGANLTVGKTAITVTADAQTKAYGAVDPVLTYKVTSGALAFADTFTGALTRVAGENIGTYPIQQGTLALNANYTLTYVDASLTIGKTAITVTADAQTKIYGEADPALSYKITNGALVGTDKFTGTLTRVAGENVGTYAVQQSTLALSSNYTLTYVGANLTITQKTLTITANNATKVYGSANPVLGVSYSGFAGSDNASNLTTQPTVSTVAVANSPVGTYPITANGAASANYTIIYKPGTLTVTSAVLTITANNVTKSYGQTLTNHVGSTAFTSSGLVGSETIGSISITYDNGSAASAAVGIYTGSVVASTATGGTFTPANYQIIYVPGNIVINQPTLTITANNASKIYGSANPVLSISYSGFVNSDNSNSLTTKPVITTTATQASVAGTYPITVSGAALANYKIVYVAGTLTVNKVKLTITAEDKSRPYGVANPVFTAVYSGFVNGDDQAALTKLPVLATVANSTSLPGSYPITASGATSANYTFNYVPGKLTVIALSNAKLINLVPTAGALNPSFNADNFSYKSEIDNDVAGVRLTLTFDPTATARINGSSPVASDRLSFNIPLNVGNNTISIVVTAQDHVTTNTYTLVIYRGEDQQNIVASNILTPNGDGKNDTWVIADIQLYPNNTVTVFDQGGRTVYTKHGYTNDWNGNYGGSPLTEGTYYYIIDLGLQQRKFKGFITIIHDR